VTELSLHLLLNQEKTFKCKIGMLRATTAQKSKNQGDLSSPLHAALTA
jgi:hypothetical protein